jgi:transglutaminase-like putative cysteine protease
MIRIRAGCGFVFESDQEIPAVFVVRPDGNGPHGMLSETWETTPQLVWHDYLDGYGNLCRRMTLPAGPSSLRYDTLVETSDALDPEDLNARQFAVADLPDHALVYTLPSRYCLSDVLAPQALELFGTAPAGWALVQTICDWVHDHIKFAYGTSSPTTTSLDVYNSGTGVCRDYAHLAITFCRALNVPARYAFGYLPDIDVPPPYPPMDFAAWFEAYLGGRWWIFDPRNNERRKGRVTIARGRDALDVAMVTTYGPATLGEMTVWSDAVSA